MLVLDTVGAIAVMWRCGHRLGRLVGRDSVKTLLDQGFDGILGREEARWCQPEKAEVIK